MMIRGRGIMEVLVISRVDYYREQHLMMFNITNTAIT